MSQTASQWNPSVQAPDLSNLMKLAGRAGRLEGTNDFMEKLLEYKSKQLLSAEREQKQAADKADKAEKEAAKEDLGNEPESEGFWSKLADMAGDGLERGLDVLSRFNYASANAAKYLVNQDKDPADNDIWDSLTGGGFLSGGVTGADIVDDLNLGDISGTLKAGWKGFTGKKKTTFADVIATGAKKNPKDNIFDSGIYQGTAGFIGDVLLDPTTYIGAGIVTKPLKKALEHGVDEKLVDDVFSLGMTRAGKNEAGDAVDITLSRDEIKAALGGNIGRPRPVGGRDLRRWRNSQTVKGRTRLSRAEDVADTRDRLDFLTAVREKARKPSLAIVDDSAIKSIDDLIESTKTELKAATEDYGRRAYREALKAFANKPSVPAKVAAETVETWDEAIDVTKATHAFRNHHFRKAAAKKGKPSKNATFDDTLGDAYKSDKRIQDDFRKNAPETVDKLANQDKRFRQIREKIYAKESGLMSQVKRLQDKLEDTTPGTDDFKNIRSQLRKVERARNEAYDQLHRIRASIFTKMLSHHVGDKNLLNGLGESYSALLAREAEINDRLKNMPSNMDSHNSEVITSQDVDASSKLDPNDVETAGSSNPTYALQQELKAIQQEKAVLLNTELGAGDTLPTPVGAPKDVHELLEFTESGEVILKDDIPEELREWAQAVEDNVQTRAVGILNNKISTWKRAKRQERMNAQMPAKLQDMFEGKTPTITVNGKKVRKNAKDLEQHIKITDADRVKYRADAQAAKNKTLDETVEVKNNPAATVAEQTKNASITKTGFAVQSIKHNAFDRIFKEQHGISVENAIKASKNTTKHAKKEVPEDYDPRVPADVRAKLTHDSNEEAIKSVNLDIKDGKLTTVLNSKVDLKGEKVISIDDVHKTAVEETREQYAARIAQEKMNHPHPNSKAARTSQKIKQLEKERDEKIKLHNEAYEQALKTAEETQERLQEQLTLDAITENVLDGKNYLRINGAGMKLVDIPAPEALVAATEKLSGLPILQKAYSAWSEAFKPASKLEPELNIARLRAQARTPDLIKHHLDSLMHNFSEFKPADRADALKVLSRGKPPVGTLEERMDKFFRDYAQHTSGWTTVDGETLTISEINRYLPDEYKFLTPGKGNVNDLVLETPEEIIKAMRRLKPGEDAMKVMWRLQISVEQAMAYKAMQSTIRKTFGVKRILRKGDQALDEPTERELLIESLRTDHDWVTVRDMGEDYYFPREIAEQTDQLLKMMKPEQTQEIMKLYDKAMRAWKASVTIYNPGYYTRNGIGEVIMSALDGLSNPKYYGKAAQWVRYAAPDEVQETLKTLEPWARHSTKSQKGARPIITLKGGKKLSLEDVDVLYHEVGLKSGFISTEYEHYFPLANTARATPVGQVATKINDKVRNKGEKYEDYFRIAHFMYRMEKSGLRDPLAAAQEAAERVRHYHFDYTDFTPFEKTKMMRVFPFYKWTRKALPLMASMIFTKPGAVTFYPKAMTGISYASGGTDPLKDKNGFYPNYEGVVPEWMRNMASYPIGADEAGAMDFMNVATPQMDIYKILQNPGSAMIGMLSPGFKVPFEQLTGETIDPDFKLDVKTKDQRLQHLLRSTPATSLLNNIYKGSQPGEDSAVTEPGGSPLDEKLTSFLTGLGFYENNESRQKGETFRRNLEKAGF